ncbi:MAG: VTT domain-containing protein [Candidatus Acidiferrales bacterium]
MVEFLKALLAHLSAGNLSETVKAGGIGLVCAIVFVETGMFVGFFLPGDSLLVIAGVLAYKGFLSLYWLLGLVTLCAISGDQLGYFIGRRAGTSLFQRQDSRFFKRSHLERAHEFYERNGGKTVIMARFIPIIRTFCPPVAGAAQMSYRKYLSYDIVGGFAWVWSMVLFGYGVVASFPALGNHVDLLVLGVILVSLIPAGLHAWKEWQRNKAAQV